MSLSTLVEVTESRLDLMHKAVLSVYANSDNGFGVCQPLPILGVAAKCSLTPEEVGKALQDLILNDYIYQDDEEGDYHINLTKIQAIRNPYFAERDK